MERDINLKVIYNIVGILVLTVFLMFVFEVTGMFSKDAVKETVFPVFNNNAFAVCIVSYFVLVGFIMWFRGRRK
ncbi:MAG: hypothetical protein ACC630_01195 [Nitrospinota bacterium]